MASACAPSVLGLTKETICRRRYGGVDDSDLGLGGLRSDVSPYLHVVVVGTEGFEENTIRTGAILVLLIAALGRTTSIPQ
jgi:hypothetical protein